MKDLLTWAMVYDPMLYRILQTIPSHALWGDWSLEKVGDTLDECIDFENSGWDRELNAAYTRYRNTKLTTKFKLI